MREALRELIGWQVPSHAGLAYDVWARTGENGKVADDDRNGWLEAICARGLDPDYPAAFERWRDSFGVDVVTAQIELAGRLLIGHGNPAPTEVGLTVHQTWGAPIIPGTALKGLLAHYVETVYGPGDAAEALREGWRGIRWDGSRIVGQPGAHYKALFGAPDSLDGGQASRGLIEIHDAWYVPNRQRAFEPDVLTVHQKHYYDAMDQPDQPPPNDYDSPIPIGFLTVAPSARFLLAVSGPENWRELAARLLLEALEQWGVGGKTSAGYGRIRAGARLRVPPCPLVIQLGEWLAEQAALPEAERLTPVQRLQAVSEHWLPALVTLNPAQRELAMQKIADAVRRNNRTAAPLDALARQLDEGRLAPEPLLPAVQVLADWLSARLQAAGEAAARERVLAELEDDWLERLAALTPEELAQARPLLRDRFPDQGERLEVLFEVLGWPLPA